MRGTWREGSFTGDPKRYDKYGSGIGIVSREAPLLETWRDTLFS
jgi:hypothetical protein